MRRRRAHSRSRADNPSPDRRPARASRVLHQQRSDAWRAAELVAGDGNEIGIRKRHLASGLSTIAKQQRAGFPDALATRSRGWITPVSLLTSWTATSAGPSASNRSSAGTSIRPSAVDGMHFGTRAHRSDDDRVLGRPDEPPRLRPRRHDLDRLARAGDQDDVMAPAQRIGDRPAAPAPARPAPRARRRGASLGLAQPSSARAIAARAPGRTGVVAA